jgi:glycosyltransferase involved in cell wall biosynthesis
VSPKVSVVMSVYNGARYLAEAIESILGQTFTDFEFIIVNDGSTDCTGDILAEYTDRDQRLILLQNEQNLGLTRSLNKGLARASGQYIARQDADDISLPQRLQRQVAFLDEHPEVVLVSSNYEVIDEEGRQLRIERKSSESLVIAWYLLFVNYVGGHSVVMFRREQVMNLSGYAEDYRYAQDYQLWLRLANRGDIAILPEILLQWRSHGQSISSLVLSEQTEFALMAVKGNMRELTGIEFNPAELTELWQLWSGFPVTPRQIGRLQPKLEIIYRAFVARRMARGDDTSTLSRQLRPLISRQLLYGARASSLAETVWFKLMILPYAWAWQPSAVLAYCLEAMRKIWLGSSSRFA